MKKIVIAGGTGFIGTYLQKRFSEDGFSITNISRRDALHNWNHESLVETLENSDLLINLSGKSINCRHTTKNKAEILRSRTSSTEKLCNAMNECQNPPSLWINASATGIYEPSKDYVNSEESGKIGENYLAKIVLDWERTFFACSLQKTRKVAMRTSVVLGKNGGALAPLATLTKLGLGGKQGDGTQIFSWIHIEDYYQQILFILNNNTITGIVNASSPEPINNNDFMCALRKTLKIPFGIPAPAFAIKLGAVFIGTESNLILDSVNIYPKKLIESGYRFRFPNINQAISDLL